MWIECARRTQRRLAFRRFYSFSPSSRIPVSPVPAILVDDDDAAAGCFVSTVQRCRGYVLSIIDAPNDRSRERRDPGLRETAKLDSERGILSSIIA